MNLLDNVEDDSYSSFQGLGINQNNFDDIEENVFESNKIINY